MRASTLLCLASIAFTPAVSQAALIPLSAPDPVTGLPDVFSDTVYFQYTTSGSTGTFTITSGSPVSKNPGAIDFNPADPNSLVLTVTLQHGALISDPVTVVSGSITLLGDLVGDGAHQQTLFHSTDIANFGFNTPSNPGAGIFEFVFHNNDGVLANGKDIGVILSSQGALPNYPLTRFTANFNNSASITGGVADTFGLQPAVVPEPGSLAVLALGAMGLVTRRRVVR